METEVDAGTYEVLRDRLGAQARELARRAEELNSRRIEAFGSMELGLTGTVRVRTERPAVPRDIVSVGGALLFGYNSPAGRSSDIAVGDVFALHDRELNPLPADAVPGLLDDPRFVREFADLYRYFRDARLLRLRRTGDRLLAVFQTGESTDDIRVLRWALTAGATDPTDPTDPANAADSTVAFLDARGDRDHVVPASHDVEWTATTREDQVLGRHPHISVDGGQVFVSTVGGALTVKTENDTESGDGIHTEPVDEPLQSLADAEVAHARAGVLILLRVRPYKEEAARYLVFNTVTRTVVRLDGIGRACRRLPEDQGIVFPGGYCLASGAYKTFDLDTGGLEFERELRSPNGEDVLYVFHARAEGRGLLLPYNLIREEVAAPLPCHGYALFEDGTLIVLRADERAEPARVHPLQIWRSAYVSDTHAAAAGDGDGGALGRIGNADLVRGISDCLSLARAVTETAAPTTAVYETLLAACVRVTDAYHWLGDPGTGDLREPVAAVRATAEQVLAEFATVQTLTRQTAEALDASAAGIAALVRRARGEVPPSAAAWVERLTELRRAHGHLLTLKERRYADIARIDALAAETEGDLTAFAQRAVRFLRRDDAFTGHHEEIAGLTEEAGALATAAGAAPLTARLDELAAGLRTVTEVVTGLDIEDATVRTSILERIAEVLGGVNGARATLDARRGELRDHEGRAEFAAESALLGQAVTGALAAADTPEACDDQLATLLLRLENLESRFAESDDFLAVLATRRGEIYETFSARKQGLQDARARRAERLGESAARVLETVGRRAAALGSADEVSTYFASDPMVAKVRRTVTELWELGNRVRAGELEGRLKAARQEASRALRDRVDLYADGGALIRLGRHSFAVNTQPLDLTLVPDSPGGGLSFALTGTDYRAPVTDPEFAATRPYWGQTLPSESPEVYRAEYLAARLLAELGPEAPAPDSADSGDSEGELAALVRRSAESAYDEGYERGVHDHDATLILGALLRLRAGAGLLRYPPAARAAAQLFWAHGTTGEARDAWTRRAVSMARARETFGLAPAIAALRRELAEAIREFTEADGGTSRSDGTSLNDDTILSAEYLFEELTGGPEGFVTGAGARTLLDKFRRAMGTSAYDDDLAGLGDDLAARRQLVENWLTAYATAGGRDGTDPGELAEATAVELCPDLVRYDSAAPLAETVDGLLGGHPRIERRRLTVRIDELLARTRDFRDRVAPGFRAYQRARAALVTAERTRLRLDDYRPRVMSSFVRNRLIDEVYLPLIGDNLAKQLGTADETKRTDSNGLLLLVSPPGYGKTTLMEYVADRLGLVLVKINGPALGHEVTSLDPDRAPNATARQEVEKINFALESGNNTLLYLDDIQHTSPELLQQFIPLCDAQRRIEGVRNGETRTYDLRGKRFAVCMAGNPYTESGHRFRIPDMLANRADVWNLGDVLTGKEDVFALSFVENALTSHPVLAPLAARDRADLDLLVRLADADPTARADRLTHPYTPAELQRVLAVLRHLLTARATVLAVNATYIASAAQSDTSRTEPPFLLQGSYRNMNKIAARIDAVMNDAELAAVIEDHYTGEAQTLTTGAESNLLKLAELRATLTPPRAARWTAIKTAYTRTQSLGGPETDPMTRAVAALGLLTDRVAAVETAIRGVAGEGAGRHR
ncbi:DNA repair ATPase [Streptomyces scopuliridis]|uniref:DNA repair ATPase n=1 Tax=Streptomyces scopuliridis TaxID=452529 RepID=A0ACD4ZKG6_9ACTN|nr:DNA repair ATPase [Streptomyces scopuliridis]WSB98478.1 DNA repair ATPase [Streptomyces scopuliridis]WSC07820.1 DNA repair ATPase [Streptomyces scopuliridis]